MSIINVLKELQVSKRMTTEEANRLSVNKIAEDVEAPQDVADRELWENFITLGEGVMDKNIFRAFFLAGGSGSGKSYVADRVLKGHGLRFINSDAAFEKYMKDANISMDMRNSSEEETEKRDGVRAKAKAVTTSMQKAYLKGRLGVVIDGTGKNAQKIGAKKKALEALGYDCHLIFVNVALDVALARNAKRSRKVPEEVATKSWNDVQKNIGKFQSMFKQNLKIIDNNDATQDELDLAWKEVMKLLKKPLKNPIATAWIKDELEKRKRK